jgi:hypothetical protein
MTAVGLSAPKMAVPATMTLLPEILTYQLPFHERPMNGFFTSFCTDANGFGTNTTVNFDIFMWESSA